MTADPIRDALEAAAWADCEARARVNDCEDKRCPRREPCQWCAAGSAAAVAAFLRALPPCDVLMDRGNNRGMHSTRTLAAAVEAAGGNDA